MTLRNSCKQLAPLVLTCWCLSHCTAGAADEAALATFVTPTGEKKAITLWGQVNPLNLARQLDADMVQIPAGVFKFGLPQAKYLEIARQAEVHPDMLYAHSPANLLVTPSFWMDRYPVTRIQFARFMAETGYRIPYNGWLVGWSTMADYWDVSDPVHGLLPVVGVNCDDARAYAGFVGKRVPTEVEWEKAARGADGRLFPWGNEMPDDYLSKGNLPLNAALPVGGQSYDRSPYGVADMGGNVMELVQRVFMSTAKDGMKFDSRNTYYFAGGSILHLKSYSHMATSRLSWHPTMRIYNAGFRCVADEPPTPPQKADLSLLGAATPPQAVSINRDSYLAEPIRLAPHECTTVSIHVPWFGRSVWVMDCPEGDWGPFGGASAWPTKPEQYKLEWKIHSDQRLSYHRVKDGKMVAFEIWAEGPLVRYRVRAKGVRLNSLGFCTKTFSPFFSSQERLTQCRWGMHPSLIPSASLPIEPTATNSFHWSVGTTIDGMIIYRALRDGDAYVVYFGVDGTEGYGNGWPPCTHFQFAQRGRDEAEAAILFFIGSEAELQKAAAQVRRALQEQRTLPTPPETPAP